MGLCSGGTDVTVGRSGGDVSSNIGGGSTVVGWLGGKAAVETSVTTDVGFGNAATEGGVVGQLHEKN